MKRGLKALKTLSFICSGQWKVENRVLVMFSLERRNFNGQFFTFLWGAKISSEDFNTPENIDDDDVDDADVDVNVDDDDAAADDDDGDGDDDVESGPGECKRCHRPSGPHPALAFCKKGKRKIKLKKSKLFFWNIIIRNRLLCISFGVASSSGALHSSLMSHVSSSLFQGKILILCLSLFIFFLYLNNYL